MQNRIQNAIDSVNARLIGVSAEKVAEIGDSLNLNSEEHAIFQEKKSLAFSMGQYTQDEAMLLYRLLGESVTVFNSQPVAVKVALNVVLMDLLKP